MAALREDDPTIHDMDQWVREWPRVSKYLKMKNHRAEYDWSGVDFIWETPDYDKKQASPLKTSSQIYKSKAFNSTDRPQAYHFKAVKKTHSHCDVALFSAIKKDGVVETTLSAPTPAVEAGFPPQVNFRDRTCSKFNEEIECHIDTPLTMEAGQGITLTVKSVEQAFASEFTVEVKVRGKVVVRVFKNDVFVARINGNFQEITTALVNSGKLTRSDIASLRHVGQKEIMIALNGRCRFQYVIDQRVKISTISKEDFEKEEKMDLEQQIQDEDARSALDTPPESVSVPGGYRFPRGHRVVSEDDDEMSELDDWSD